MKVHFTGCKIYLAYGNESFSDEILWCLTIESIAGKCCTVSPIIFFAPIHGPSFEISICRKYWIVAPISMCFIYVIHVAATFTKPFNLLFRHFLYIFDLCCTCVCYSLCNNNTSYMDISSHYDHYVHTSKEALNMLKCLSHEHEIVQTDKKATHKRIEFNSQMVSILKRLQCLNEYLNEVVQCKEKKSEQLNWWATRLFENVKHLLFSNMCHVTVGLIVLSSLSDDLFVVTELMTKSQTNYFFTFHLASEIYSNRFRAIADSLEANQKS